MPCSSLLDPNADENFHLKSLGCDLSACTDINKISELERYAVNITYEFLLNYGFDETLRCFVKEVQKLGYSIYDPPPECKDRIKREDVAKILEHFSNKLLAPFFDAWDNLIPATIKSELEYKKLTFYLHVYFAILSLSPCAPTIEYAVNDGHKNDNTDNKTETDISNEPKELLILDKESETKLEITESFQGMEKLKNFLETKGNEFSGETEFLPFYALPYVKNPSSHPSFKSLFMDSWIAHLGNNLRQFLGEQSWGTSVAPKLLQACCYYQQKQRHLCSVGSDSLLRKYRQLRRTYYKLHRDHHNLIGVAAELTGALENSVTGQEVDLEKTLSNCTKIYPELFSNNLKSELKQEVTPEEIIRGSIAQSQERHSVSSMSSFELDFKKIKHHLQTGSMKTKLLLFQALRWRITRSSREERDLVVAAFTRHDVLSLHPQIPQRAVLSAHLIPPDAATPHPLQQSVARLVNALASLRAGRDYLCSGGSSLQGALVPCLTGQKDVKIDAVTSDMILASLQKLSLRCSQRVNMIESGLVEWLVQELESKTLRPYTLEYSTALLMNLCLHRRAKERCVPLAKSILKILTDLLGNNLIQAMPYVNGTLYSLLANQQINHEAKKMGLSDILEYYHKHSTGEMQHQLEYILKLHKEDYQLETSNMSEDESADDDTEEIDLLEDELDADDPVTNVHGELSGDELLYQQYRQLFPHHGMVLPITTSLHTGELLVRPTTPRLHSARKSETKEAIDSPPDLILTDVSSPQRTVVKLMETEEDNEPNIEATEKILQEPPNNFRDSTSGLSVEQNSTLIPTINEEGEDEYVRAFTSRPRIPRTPTRDSHLCVMMLVFDTKESKQMIG